MGSNMVRYLLILFASIVYPATTLAAEDKLTIIGIDPGDSVVVALKGRTSAGCGARALRSTGDTALPNYLRSATCRSEIAVFSEKHAMVHELVDTWTDSPGDVLTITLRPVILVPVSVWTAGRADEQRAKDDMRAANERYLKNRVGIRFDPTYHTVSPAGVAIIGTVSCGAVAAIRGSAFYTPNTLNVYYVNGGFAGRNCALTQTPPDCRSAPMTPALDANITYIGTMASGTTLAHEFGHAFGLRPSPCSGHTNGLPGFGRDNVMWAAGGDERVHFSLGQVFRINTHRDQWGGTMLIKNNLRPGPGRKCPPNVTSAACPALRTGWPP